MQRWTDERCDDLAKLVHSNFEQQLLMRREIDKHEEALVRIAKSGDRRTDRNWQLILTGFMVTITSVANIIVNLLHQVPR